jgi:hypothetical protein
VKTSPASKLAVAAALSLTAVACGAREKVSLAYPGEDARQSTHELSQAISDRGLAPICKTGKFCKFSYSGGGTVHFKLTKREPMLVLDTPEEMEPDARAKMESEMRELAMSIWKDVSTVALAKEKEARKVAEAREAAERKRDDERYRMNTEARLESERIQAQRDIANANAAAAGAERAAAERAAAEQAAAMQVYERFSFESRARGSALRVELPEAAYCKVKGDQGDAQRTLEIPFQIETFTGSFTTIDCDLGQGSQWRRKLQARAGQVTVVQLFVGAPGTR